MKAPLLFAVALFAAGSLGAYGWQGNINAAPGFADAGTVHPDPAGQGKNGLQLHGITEKLPYGSPGQSHVGFAAWDYFYQGIFLEEAPQYTGTGAPLNVVLSQYGADAVWSDSILPDNGNIVNGQGGRLHASNSPIDFSLTGSALSEIRSLSVSLKHSMWIPGYTSAVPIDQLPPEVAANPNVPHVPFFNMALTLDGNDYIPQRDYLYDSEGPYGVSRFYASEAATSVFFVVTTFTWDVVIEKDELFEINFAHPADYFSIDAIAFHTEGIPTAVPEPTAAAMVGAVALLAALRRRKKSILR